MGNTKKKKQWHPAFCSAIKLEFRENKDILDYESEYNINTKPIQVDLLIIKECGSDVIDNELGRLFRGHNLVEYKSPDDELNEDVIWKTLGYAYLYKASEPKLNKIILEDITIIIIRKRKPVKLLKELVKHFKFIVTNPYAGIYYVVKEGFFPIQIVVSKELTKSMHIWLTSLTSGMSESDVRKLVYCLIYIYSNPAGLFFHWTALSSVNNATALPPSSALSMKKYPAQFHYI